MQTSAFSLKSITQDFNTFNSMEICYSVPRTLPRSGIPPTCNIIQWQVSSFNESTLIVCFDHFSVTLMVNIENKISITLQNSIYIWCKCTTWSCHQVRSCTFISNDTWQERQLTSIDIVILFYLPFDTCNKANDLHYLPIRISVTILMRQRE